MRIRKKDGRLEAFDAQKIIAAIRKSAARVMVTLSAAQEEAVVECALTCLAEKGVTEVDVPLMHNAVETALSRVAPEVGKSYRDYRNYKQEFVYVLDDIYKGVQAIHYIGDRDNANTDSALASTKRSLEQGLLSKALYKQTFLTPEELQAANDGYIYIHDMSARRTGFNCCLFDVARVLSGGFEMGNMWYNEPNSLDTAFDVIGDIIMSSASQQYGGHTTPEVDTILEPYAQKSYEKYLAEYNSITDKESSPVLADEYATAKVRRDFEQGFQGWEYKFNTVASSRGDYPFIAMSFGLGKSRWAQMATEVILETRMNGQGKKGFKRPVLFPKLTFLYDEALHGEGKPLEHLFEKAIDCSQASCYPDYVSLSGEGYIPSVYKKYGKVVSLMGEQLPM